LDELAAGKDQATQREKFEMPLLLVSSGMKAFKQAPFADTVN
jgi:hypothetical protein